jgi:hemin uptake protein HemP
MTSPFANSGDRHHADRPVKHVAAAATQGSTAGAANTKAPQANPNPRAAGKIIAFHELTDGKNVVLIELDNQYYQLSRTRSGKLVLTK